MYENDLATGTDYEYNSNLEKMMISKKETQERINLDLINNLLDENKSYSDLSQEDLIRLKKEHEELFKNLPQKLAPENQSELEKAIREDYKEICDLLASIKD
jgi:protein subunit release factor A